MTDVRNISATVSPSAAAGGRTLARPPRQSNFELLRIVAMFLVLVLHADFLSLGVPEAKDFAAAPANAWTRTFFEMMAICAVNVFVMISGWFGIRGTLRGGLRFLFQACFFYFGIYGVMLLTGGAEMTAKNLLECMKMDWFTISYLTLFIISPVLNAFARQATVRQFAGVLAAFFLLQTLYGCTELNDQFNRGYSAISFAGIYLLARFMSLHRRRFFRFGLLVYLACLLAKALIFWALSGSEDYNRWALYYINPLVILQAAALVAFVSTVKMPVIRIINRIAASAYAVYLLHINDFILVKYFKSNVVQLYNQYSGVECIGLILMFLVVVFCAGILIDQVRILLWNAVSVWLPALFRKSSRKPEPAPATE